MKKILFVFVVILLFSCQTTEEKTIKNLRSIEAKKYENYHFDRNTRIIERIQDAPNFLIEYINNMDNRKDYSPYPVSEREKEEVISYIEKRDIVNSCGREVEGRPRSSCLIINQLTVLEFSSRHNEREFCGTVKFPPGLFRLTA